MYAISQRSALMIKKVLVVPGGYINITLVNDYFLFSTRTIDTHRKISFLSPFFFSFIIDSAEARRTVPIIVCFP